MAAKKPVLDEEFWQKLADVQPFGIELEPHHVQSWFDTVWPQYSERHYKKHRKAIASWWSRCYEDDIHRAIERYDTLHDRESVQKMEDRLPPADHTDNVIDFFAKVVGN